MVPRLKIDTFIHVYNFQDLFRITRRKEKKTSGNKGFDGKNGKKIYFYFYLLLLLLLLILILLLL